ncbi:alpha/beta fold hydrolase [Roseomonas sp. PWR1]|uniref:Alpha/beta fold hydrolase n=1 Tax=Roseomonas nitratireducens TaxID=2820810 RepID=A0ABS4APQ2_9PROT|nr:alpha/beta fold hydrolase BchO [Neoroseomonas nitratireducens]MBP0463344.1 alpha/beta fold hydrolase [Neoroseomonas nitratireducens]
MSDRPHWPSDGRDWPNRATSRFVRAGGIDWHVQVAGQGPVLLLLHGTAAATHSWRDLLPLLSPHATVVAPDLPGHGFTALPADIGLTLPGMARLVDALLTTLGLTPDVAVGHSAGAAVALRMALDGRIAPRAVVSLNGALTPLGEEHAAFFTRAARMLVGLPFVPRLFAWRAADRAVAERLLRDTGSRIDARGVDLYARLFRRAGHLSGALRMMANWDLKPLLRDLPRLASDLLLVVGGNDRTIPPEKAQRVAAIAPHARIERLPGLGHLAHEERPDLVAAILLRLLQREMAET